MTTPTKHRARRMRLVGWDESDYHHAFIAHFVCDTCGSFAQVKARSAAILSRSKVICRGLEQYVLAAKKGAGER